MNLKVIWEMSVQAKARPSSAPMTKPLWPLWAWSVQFLPAAFLMIFAVWRLSVGDRIQSDALTSILALLTGGVWFAAALGMLVVRGGRQWLVHRRREWFLSVAIILFGLALMDVLMTALGWSPTVAEQRAHSIVYTYGAFTGNRLIPKEILLKGNDPIHINRRGFRGAEIVGKKKPGNSRIVILGGSQVFDYDGGDWPAMVGEELRRRGHDVDVINAGVPGHDTTESLGKLLTDIWTLEPDIIFLCQAWNDIKYFSRLSPEEPLRGLPPLEPESWRKDWRVYPTGIDRFLSASAIYRQFRWGLAHFLYGEEGRQRNEISPSEISSRTIGKWGAKQYRLNLNLIAELSQHMWAELVLCKQAHLSVEDGTGPAQETARDYGRRMVRLPHRELMRAYEQTNRVIDAIARERNLLVIDMNRALSGRSEYFADGIHFNPAGSRAASKLVALAIEPLVVRAAARQNGQ